MELNIIHNTEKYRFETTIGDLVAVLNYIVEPDGCLKVTHTGVPKELEGQGIAAALTKTMLEYVKENKITVRPICPYTVTYIQRHPEYEVLLKDY